MLYNRSYPIDLSFCYSPNVIRIVLSLRDAFHQLSRGRASQALVNFKHQLAIMADEPKPLPFLYQFAAGAVAGVSEVSQQLRLKALAKVALITDSSDVIIHTASDRCAQETDGEPGTP